MNDKSLIELENQKAEILKKYELDPESIAKFKSKIKKVDQITSDEIGKKIFEALDLPKKKNISETELRNNITELILAGANIEYKDSKGRFPLIVSIRRGYDSITYLLLRAGANINQTTNYLTTPVMDAARYGNRSILELLIILGADINAECLDGDTALISAIIHEKDKCYALLKEHGAHLDHRNDSNKMVTSFNLKRGQIIDGDLLFMTEGQHKETAKDNAQALIAEAEQKLKKIKF